VASPFKMAEFDIMFDRGISKEGSILDVGVGSGVIEKRGAFFSYGETRLGQGRENAKQFLQENGEIAAHIEAEIRKGRQFTPKAVEDIVPEAEEPKEVDTL